MPAYQVLLFELICDVCDKRQAVSIKRTVEPYANAGDISPKVLCEAAGWDCDPFDGCIDCGCLGKRPIFTRDELNNQEPPCPEK